MTKRSTPKDSAARREYGRLSVALHRAKKAAYLSDLQDSINYHRERVGLPPRDFFNGSDGSNNRKGSKKLVYLPSEEMLVQITKEELTQWKINERRKRKRARGRERKMAEDQEMRELRKELTELEGMVGELDTGVEVYVKPVVVVLEETAAVADADVKSSTDTATIEMEDVKSGFIAEDSLSGFSEALLKSSPEENYTDDSKLINNQVTLNSTTNGTDTTDTTKTELLTFDFEANPENFDPIPLDRNISSNTFKTDDLFEGLDSSSNLFPIMDNTDELMKDTAAS